MNPEQCLPFGSFNFLFVIDGRQLTNLTLGWRQGKVKLYDESGTFELTTQKRVPDRKLDEETGGAKGVFVPPFSPDNLVEWSTVYLVFKSILAKMDAYVKLLTSF